MLTAVVTPTGQVIDIEPTRATLKSLTAITVVVDLSDAAEELGLTHEMIRTDVELKLRLAGVRVVTNEESHKLKDEAMLYVAVNIFPNGRAECIEVGLNQNAQLIRNGTIAPVTTWSVSSLGANLNAQQTRDGIKDGVDRFLNAWLSVIRNK